MRVTNRILEGGYGELKGRADRRKRKGPQGYDEDNASLDKFCKIKAKKGETQGRPTAGGCGKRGVQRMGVCKAGVGEYPRLRRPTSKVLSTDPRMQAQQLSPYLGIETIKFARVSTTGSFRSSRTIVGVVYRTRHFDFLPDFLPGPALSRAARVADSKTSRTPSLVRAEHSRYL